MANMNGGNDVELEALKGLAELLVREKAGLEKELTKIDEKYRKLAEQEKAETAAKVKKLSGRIDVYSSLINGLTDDADAEKGKAVPGGVIADGTGKPAAAKESPEPEIKDSLFPENNAQGDETGVEESVADPRFSPKTNVQVKDGNDGSAIVATADGIDAGVRMNAGEETQELQEEHLTGDDPEDWPDMPEEWN